METQRENKKQRNKYTCHPTCLLVSLSTCFPVYQGDIKTLLTIHAWQSLLIHIRGYTAEHFVAFVQLGRLHERPLTLNFTGCHCYRRVAFAALGNDHGAAILFLAEGGGRRQPTGD